MIVFVAMIILILCMIIAYSWIDMLFDREWDEDEEEDKWDDYDE